MDIKQIIAGYLNAIFSHDGNLHTIGEVSHKRNDRKGDAAKTLLMDYKLQAMNTYRGTGSTRMENFDPGIIHEGSEKWTNTSIREEM